MSRTTDYEDHKKRRNIRITDTAWEGLQEFATYLDTSISQLLEEIGRNTISEPEYRKFLKDKKAKKALDKDTITFLEKS